MNSVFSRFLSSRLPKPRIGQVIRLRYLHRARLARYRGVDDAGIEAIVDRDVAGQRIIDALLGLERQHDAPAGHMLGPLDGMDAEIGAAVDRDDAVAIIPGGADRACSQQSDLVRVVRGLVEELKSGAVGHVGPDDVLIEPVHDEGAVIRRRGDQGELAWRFGRG